VDGGVQGHFRLGDRSICHPPTVQDDATRYVLGVDGHGSTSTEPVAGRIERIFRDRGLPERIHSENGCRLRRRACAASRG
jgi:hypothetical protein